MIWNDYLMLLFFVFHLILKWKIVSMIICKIPKKYILRLSRYDPNNIYQLLIFVFSSTVFLEKRDWIHHCKSYTICTPSWFRDLARAKDVCNYCLHYIFPCRCLRWYPEFFQLSSLFHIQLLLPVWSIHICSPECILKIFTLL